MADSILDVGVDELFFPLVPNWVETPNNKFTITRYLFEYRGTASQIEQQNLATPFVFTARFDVNEKQQEFDLLTFLHNVYGRTKRFWIRYPKTLMDLTQSIGSGSTGMRVKADNSNLLFSGYERIYILMNNGDLIVRRITAASYNSVADDVDLTLVTPFDRNIELDDYIEIGRYLLVRFDADDFTFGCDSDIYLQMTQRFYELTSEYEELAANP